MAKLKTVRVREIGGDPDFKFLINEKDFDPELHERVRKDLVEEEFEEEKIVVEDVDNAGDSEEF